MAEKTVSTPADERAVAPQETTRAQDTFVAPPVDIFEDRNGLTVLADLPGVEPDTMDIRVDQGVLTIQARTSHQLKGSPIHREYQLVSFFRQFQLTERVDIDHIAADLQNGVLKLQLPWVPEVKPRRIEVKSS